MSTQVKKVGWMLLAIPILLAIPLIASFATDQVNWTLEDYVVMGLMLLATVLVIAFIGKVVPKKYRGLLTFGAILVFLLVWAELAVGIFGSSFAGS